MFDINSEKSIQYSEKLGRLHRSHLPVAVRSTLNQAAFEAKRNIPITASRGFTTRKKSFMRAFSMVQKAGGFDINTMQSTVGINPAKGSKVAEGLEAQEKGGTIKGRKLIAHDKARVSGSHGKVVKKKHRLAGMRIGKPGQKGNFNYLLIKKGSKGTVFEIKQTGRRRKLEPVYTYRSTKVSRVKPTPFVKQASMIARRKMPAIYKKEAAKRFKKALQ